jgi:endonuclease G
MATANLKEKASYGLMQRLGDLVKQRIESEMTAAAERAGREPTTGAEAFEDRNGYIPDFLDGWEIPLPLAAGDTAEDMLELKRGGTGVELKYENFSVIMSKSRRLPMLTAANINGAESRKVPRIDVWSFDGRIDEEDQWGDALYDSNILDRGHMVRREDPVWGDRADIANRDTFHFTNSCPQVAGVNQKTWLGLENYILQNARTDEMMVNVYTGPYFTDDDLIYREAQIPLAFWKVVAIVTEDGRPSATAYRVSQEKELSELEFVYSAYKTFQVSIQSIIDETGIDFSALLEYDGFSEEERRTGQRLEVKLETLADVRI